MKKLIAATAMMMAIAGCTPMPVKEVQPVESIMEVPGYSKDQIFTSTKAWIAENFVSAKAVIQDEDKEAGRVIGNGRIKYPCSGLGCLGESDWTLAFTMRVDMKDQKMRVTFTNLGISWPPGPGIVGAGYEHAPRESQMEDVRPALLKLADELKSSIEQGKASNKW